MLRRACASGAGRRSIPPTSRRSGPGSTGRGNRPSPNRHPSEGWGQCQSTPPSSQIWMPACAGMTKEKPMTDTVKVLIADKMDPRAAAIFRERGITVDEKPGLTPEELKAIIGDYDGLAVRSSTKVNAAAMDAALPRLKVIGRAGIGVDTIDVPAASARGIVVMNTPFGNSITTAEHAIAMLFALAREIPQANQSTQSGRWEKNRFMGVELAGKT